MNDEQAARLLELLADYFIAYGTDSPPNQVTAQETAADLIDTLPAHMVEAIAPKLERAFGYGT